MKISIEKRSLLRSLSRAQAIVERRHSIPILANIKLDAIDKTSLKLSTTDMDLYVTDTIAATVQETGAVTVPVHTLFEIIRKIPDNSLITFKYSEQGDEQGVAITTDVAKFTLPWISANEFPDFTDGSYTTEFSIPAQVLHKLLIKTRYAASIEETRYYLNGVYLHTITNNNGVKVLRTVATDSHRLASAEVKAPSGVDDITSNVIIPRKAVNEIIKLLEDKTKEASVYIAPQKIVIRVDSTTLASKVIDGKFPDYTKAIPAQFTKVMDVGAKALSDAVDLVTIISSDKTKSVSFFLSQEKLTLATNANGHSSAKYDIEASYSDIEPMHISFNGRYILDALTTIDGQSVRFNINNSDSAILVQDINDSSVLHILMPMQA